MEKEYSFEGFSIFVHSKTIKESLGKAKVVISEKDLNITLPYYVIHGKYDNEEFQVPHLLMSYGRTTIDSLKRQVERVLNKVQKI